MIRTYCLGKKDVCNDISKCSGCKHFDGNGIKELEVVTTNFDRIKNMSVDELADFICDIYASNEHREIRVDGHWMFPEDVEEWLEREVDT